MKEPQEMKKITVSIEGVEYELRRDEILEDPKLGDLFTDLEEILVERARNEYELKKLVYAQQGAQNMLQQLAIQYINAKLNPPKPEGEGEGDKVPAAPKKKPQTPKKAAKSE